MNQYINLTPENIDAEHICCAIGDPKHQAGVLSKKQWIKDRLKDGHVFRKLDARGKAFVEYEPIESALSSVRGAKYMYIYCLWVAGAFKGKGIAKELLNYAIQDAKHKGKNGICVISSKKKMPFISDRKFFEHFGFLKVDAIGEYELLALNFDSKNSDDMPKFSPSARNMSIENKSFCIYYTIECPFVSHQVEELKSHASNLGIKIDFIEVRNVKMAQNVPCVFNNWANFYNGKFISNTILNANSLDKLLQSIK